MIQVVSYASLKAEPWANGGGVTRQVASGNAVEENSGSTMSTVSLGSTVSLSSTVSLGIGARDQPWDWRISIADIAKPGPFSTMPGFDRIVTIIDGDLVALSIDGVEHGLEKYRPYRFSGDSKTSAALPMGALKDLNVITKRGVFKGFTTFVELSKQRPHPISAGQFAILLQGNAVVADVVAGAVDADAQSGTTEDAGLKQPLKAFDTVVGSEGAPKISGRGFIAIVSIVSMVSMAD